MNRLMLREKSNSIGKTLINIMVILCYEFFIIMIMNLLMKMSDISGSEWFEECSDVLTMGNTIAIEKLKTIRPIIRVYGVGALIVLTLIFCVIIKNTAQSVCERVKIMDALGYTRKQVATYFISGYGLEYTIATIPAILGVIGTYRYSYRLLDITQILKEADVDFAISGALIIGVVAAVLIVGVTAYYRYVDKSINKNKKTITQVH